MHRLCITLLFTALCAGPSKGAAQEELSYRVAGERLGCLVENSGKYLESDENLLIIALEACPEIPIDPMLAVTKNVNPDLPPLDEDLDRLVVFTRDELDCIARQTVDKTVFAYDVFPERCTISPRAEGAE